MSEKPQNISRFLVDRYYKAEKLTVMAGLLLIFFQVFALDDAITIPFLNVRLRDPSKLPLLATVILLFCLVLTWIEWRQSSGAARRTTLSRVRFGIVLAIAFTALWMNLPALTKGTTVASVSRLWYLAYAGLGLAFGIVVSSLVFATLMIRTKEEAIVVSLPRVPVATRSQFIVFGPVLFALLWIYFVANWYTPPGFMLFGPWLTEVLVLALLLATVGDLCLYRDAEGKRISYKHRITQLKEIHSTHDYLYRLSGRNPSVSARNESPKELQKAIRDQFPELRIEVLQEFRARLYTKDAHPNNQDPDNVGVKIELPDPRAGAVRFRIWPKGEDPPKNVKELTVRLDVLEKHALAFARASASPGREPKIPELLKYTINEAVKETLEEETKFPLLAAAWAGRLDLIEKCLSKGADLNERGPYGWTPLLMASAQGYPRLVKFMLERGANPDISNLQRITPLMYAARYGNLQIAKCLIDFGASIDLQDVFKDTALGVAVANGNEAVVRLLLFKGANREIKNRDRQTPLDLAYKRGQGRIARLLKTQKKRGDRG